MNFSEHDIDIYCKGKMPEEQRLSFEKALTTDKALQEEVNMRLAVINGLKEIHREALKKTLIEASTIETQKTQKIYWRVAAMFVLLAVAFAWYYFNLKQGDLYTEYYAYYPNYEINITRGNSDSTLRAKPFIEYANKNYTHALNGFDFNLKQDTLDFASRFYRGLAYLELNQVEKALIDLEISARSSSRYAETANWYAALAALKLNDNSKASSYLNKLSKDENPYQKKSNLLLKKIK
jgi:hypothetical protein